MWSQDRLTKILNRLEDHGTIVSRTPKFGGGDLDAAEDVDWLVDEVMRLRDEVKRLQAALRQCS